MPWFKVDDGLPTNKRVLAIQKRVRSSAIGLWTLAGAWSSKELTDGWVPKFMIEELASTSAIAAHLVKVGLWEEGEREGQKGYQFKDWGKYQPTKKQVEAEREAAAERQRKWREEKKRNASVTA